MVSAFVCDGGVLCRIRSFFLRRFCSISPYIAACMNTRHQLSHPCTAATTTLTLLPPRAARMCTALRLKALTCTLKQYIASVRVTHSPCLTSHHCLRGVMSPQTPRGASGRLQKPILQAQAIRMHGSTIREAGARPRSLHSTATPTAPQLEQRRSAPAACLSARCHLL